MICFVLSASPPKQFFLTGESSPIANHKSLFKRFLKLILHAKCVTPCERVKHFARKLCQKLGSFLFEDASAFGKK